MCRFEVFLNGEPHSGTTERKSGSGRPRSASTPANVGVAEGMICSQEDAPGSQPNIILILSTDKLSQ